MRKLVRQASWLGSTRDVQRTFYAVTWWVVGWDQSARAAPAPTTSRSQHVKCIALLEVLQENNNLSSILLAAFIEWMGSVSCHVQLGPSLIGRPESQRTCHGCPQNQRTGYAWMFAEPCRELAIAVCRTRELTMAVCRTREHMYCCLTRSFGCLHNQRTCYGCLQNQRTKEQTVAICRTGEQAMTVCRTKEQAMAARRTEHMLNICLKYPRTCYGCLQNQKTCYGCLQNEPTWPWAKSLVFSVTIWIVKKKEKRGNRKWPSTLGCCIFVLYVLHSTFYM